MFILFSLIFTFQLCQGKKSSQPILFYVYWKTLLLFHFLMQFLFVKTIFTPFILLIYILVSFKKMHFSWELIFNSKNFDHDILCFHLWVMCIILSARKRAAQYLIFMYPVLFLLFIYTCTICFDLGSLFDHKVLFQWFIKDLVSIWVVFLLFLY